MVIKGVRGVGNGACREAHNLDKMVRGDNDFTSEMTKYNGFL
jgi:hypothetical protein